MAFNMGIFSRGNRNAGQDMAANSEFGEAGDSQFLQAGAASAPAPVAPTPAPAVDAGDSEAPLRLRDALRRRDATAPAAPVEAGAGFKLPLIGHLPAQRQLSVLSSALAAGLALSAVFVALNTIQRDRKSVV